MIRIAILFLSVVFGTAPTACRRYETSYAAGFKISDWDSIKLGDSESEVRTRVGGPLLIRTWAEFDNGSINIFDGELSRAEWPHCRRVVKVMCYSLPARPSGDYEAHEIGINESGIVEWKSRYKTD